MRRPHALALLLGMLAVASACYVGPVDSQPTSSQASTEPTTTPGRGDGGANDASGLPCDVDALLAKHCRGCHVAGGPAPMPLATYEDLVAPSASTPAESNAVASIGRLRSSTRPMPPPPNARVASAEIGVLEAWVGAGLPRGTCGAPAGASDGGASANRPASVCTSNVVWASTRKGPAMQPGRACITCHEAEKNKPVVWLGGTVYPTLHEPDGCYGVDGTSSPVTVVVTDATGRVVELVVGPTGNFSLDAKLELPLTMPIRAKVVSSHGERVMTTPQSTGNCNACHTEGGANGAPGRILAP